MAQGVGGILPTLLLSFMINTQFNIDNMCTSIIITWEANKKEVYIVKNSRDCNFITTDKPMLGRSQFQRANIEGGDVYRYFIQINSRMIHLGSLKIQMLV